MAKFIYTAALTILMEECEEPGCRMDATKVWEGRKVCDDHYDFYRDQYERMVTGLPEKS